MKFLPNHAVATIRDRQNACRLSATERTTERRFSILEYICDPGRELGKSLKHLVEVSLGHPRLLGAGILVHLLYMTLINRVRL